MHNLVEAQVKFYFVKSKFEKKSELYEKYNFQTNDGLKNYLNTLDKVLQEQGIYIQKISYQSEPSYGCKCSITKQNLMLLQGRFQDKLIFQKFLENLVKGKDLYHVKGLDEVVVVVSFGDENLDKQGNQVEKKQEQFILYNNSNGYINQIKSNYNEQQSNKYQNKQQLSDNILHQISNQQYLQQNLNHKQNEISKKAQEKKQQKIINQQKNPYDTEEEDEEDDQSTPYQNDDENSSQNQHTLNDGFLDQSNSTQCFTISVDQQQMQQKIESLEYTISVKNGIIKDLEIENKKQKLQIQQLEKELQKYKSQSGAKFNI
ncbi:hypothetical protein ABPG74_011896 [Tetrahymena malaccensis]